MLLYFQGILVLNSNRLDNIMVTQFDLSSLGKTGKDVLIDKLVSIVRPELIVLGSHVAIDPFFHCTTALETGDYVHISSHVSIIGGKNGFLKMGNFTNISAHGIMICGSDSFKGEGIVSTPGLPQKYQDTLMVEPIVFEDFVNTGARVTIMPGVTLPQGAVIGTNSLVLRRDTLEPWTIYAGNPLRKIGLRKCEHMLEFAKKLGY